MCRLARIYGKHRADSWAKIPRLDLSLDAVALHFVELPATCFAQVSTNPTMNKSRFARLSPFQLATRNRGGSSLAHGQTVSQPRPQIKPLDKRARG